MESPMHIYHREALAAPADRSEMVLQSIVILVVSILSILGAGWIIVSFFVVFKSLRSFRHQLILGLAASDFLMALNFLSSTAMNINGKEIGAPEHQTFCSFNGFMTQVFVIQTDYWVLTIAMCTYVILAGYKSLSSWVQDQRIFLSCVPWVLSLLWAGIGLKLAGYGDIGAWCWFTSDEVRLLANFVPRWVIIITILSMYARLYFILRKSHKSFISLGNSNSTSEPSRERTITRSNHDVWRYHESDAAGRRRLQRHIKMAVFHVHDLQAQMKLFYPPEHSEVHDVISTPIFTDQVGKYLKQHAPKKKAPQYGLLACDISNGSALNESSRLFYNVAAPSSVFICGSQGSGKSHTLATLLENCLMRSVANVLTRPLAGLVFHYDSFVSDSGGIPCEAACLSSNKKVSVRVLCPPTNTATIKVTSASVVQKKPLTLPKNIYACLPNVTVQELRFSQDDLNTKRMLNLMVASPGQGDKMPLYLHTVMRILRELRIKQQQRGGGFNYQEFKNAMKAANLSKQQSAPLHQRLETLESFMVKQDAPAEGPKGKKGKGKAALKNQGKVDWTPVSGQLTIVDLSCPCVTAEQACSLFDICLSLFLEQKTDLGRVVALDESHKYMNNTNESNVFTESLLSAIRLQRHNGTRIIISTQEPTVSPSLLDLCSITIVHRFTSPVWLQVLRRHLAGASDNDESGAKGLETPNESEQGSKQYWTIPASEIFSNIVQLRTGEAFVFAPSAIVDAIPKTHAGASVAQKGGDWQPVFLGDGIIKAIVRNRITADGGKSIIAS
ncbi:hypothetical protein HZS61_010706 [Fusarium oxysporum f. sp. conglutinans]|uniref:Glucose receptor Git3-like N-terminal domain-containing protein n=1 Tax=Fusarium oxysporum f. sp. conglutinans TaxID=100902 RepID=A0A8H6LN92_FUSOX|nr:hypothetical protein HZS61_010706 [Fusarium oxysporum f. sp. conglutinans]